MIYILATAGELEEFRERELGRLHIIKYIYLADLGYAERNDGQTWTGIEWEFYRFGPWSNELYKYMQGALAKTGAERKTFPSAYSEEDYERWLLMKARIATKLTEMRAARASDVPSPEPRYDNIFFAAVESINKSDLPALPTTRVTAKFSSEVWKSKARYDPDLSE